MPFTWHHQSIRTQEWEPLPVPNRYCVQSKWRSRNAQMSLGCWGRLWKKGAQDFRHIPRRLLCHAKRPCQANNFSLRTTWKFLIKYFQQNIKILFLLSFRLVKRVENCLRWLRSLDTWLKLSMNPFLLGLWQCRVFQWRMRQVRICPELYWTIYVSSLWIHQWPMIYPWKSASHTASWGTKAALLSDRDNHSKQKS